MEQVITGRFDGLDQAEGAATKLRTIRANDVEITEWNGGSFREDDRNVHSGISAFGYGASSSVGMSGGFSTTGLGFVPYMGNDLYTHDNNQGYILNALIQDEHRDKAVRIIREAGGREF